MLNPKYSGQKGGVIILLTDGEQNTGTDIDDNALINKIKSDEVRIVTMAFGKDSDAKLENLAFVSHGQTYFIPDGEGLEDLDSAFEGALTYQPSVPITDEDIVV